MTTAFVLSGGGSLGAVQVGMLQALHDRGVVPDMLIGASAGALNAAFVAGRGFNALTVRDLERLWLGLRRHDVFPLAPRRHLFALAGLEPSICPPHRLEQLVRANVSFTLLEDAAIPLHVVATDVL